MQIHTHLSAKNHKRWRNTQVSSHLCDKVLCFLNSCHMWYSNVLGMNTPQYFYKKANWKKKGKHLKFVLLCSLDLFIIYTVLMCFYTTHATIYNHHHRRSFSPIYLGSALWVLLFHDPFAAMFPVTPQYIISFYLTSFRVYNGPLAS